MNLKNAIVYRAELPLAEHLRKHLSAHPFVEPTSGETSSAGFVPRVGQTDHDLVTELADGVAFAVRIAEKVIPASAVQSRLDEVVRAKEESTGCKVGRKQRKIMKEDVLFELTSRAFSRVSQITCLYHTVTRTLVVASGSRRHADKITSLLVKAVESMKTETIHVSHVAFGLTKLLSDHLASPDGDIFGDFHPCNSASLEDSLGRRLQVKMGNLGTATEAIRTAISQGFSVTSIGLMDGTGFEFRLTDKFRLCAMEHEMSFEPSTEETEHETFCYEAGHKLSNVVRTISGLAEMLAYVAPKEADEPTPS